MSICQFCNKDLLTNLHESACHNTVFGFTDIRGVFGKPCDAIPLLKVWFTDDGNMKKTIQLNHNTIHYIGNEAVRYLIAVKIVFI